MVKGGDAPPQKHFIHTQATHFTAIFFFYAYGNTPPTDLLQHIPHDAPRADILSLGCSDLRDLLYSILLHGRRGLGCGPVPRPTNFVINDWEPAIHARNLMLLQLVLDSRHLLEGAPAGGADGAARGMEALAVDGDTGAGSVPPSSQRGKSKRAGQKKASKEPKKKAPPAKKTPAHKAASSKPSPGDAAFAQRIGAIFCTMYNMFVDADALEMIYDVAGRLAALAASPEDWAASELGRIVRFADDRSRDRVRKILARYTDGSLQDEGVFTKIRAERTAFLATYLRQCKKPSIISRAMGLASLCQDESMEPSAKMRRHYINQGILDPYPLLLDEGSPAKRKGPFKKVNPLLLVTERKGAAPSLHYGAFPLDAFHTDVSWWKLQPDDRQEEFGKLAPAVTKPREGSAFRGGAKLGTEARQNSWFGAALEELAQMCGAFLAATDGARATPPDSPISNTSAAAATHLTITLQVGEVLNFCDALLTAKPSLKSAGELRGSGRGAGSGDAEPSGAVFEPVSFQQASLQPLHLRADVFGCPPEFDVIHTSNMAEHLGITNLLVAAAPLLKTLPHAVLLTSLMASLANLFRYKDTAEFQEKLLCMSPHVAGILLGVVPATNLSSVVGHADTMSLMAGTLGKMFSRPAGAAESAPSQLRLAWKRPTAAACAAATAAAEGSAPEPDLVDITPTELVGLTLPIYKAMSPMAGNMTLSKAEWEASLTMANHYTSVSFVRLVALAGRRLRLTQAHFRAVLNALMNDSGMLMASNLCQEQMALFHALDLAPITINSFSPGRPLPLDTRRIVLLVPKRGLDLLRAFSLPGVYLSMTANEGPFPFDNHFNSVHQAYVRVHRGSRTTGEDSNLGEGGWRSMGTHLSVRDAREDDPQAELMVSALVPAAALAVTDPRWTEVQLRARESAELFNAPKDVLKKLGGKLTKVFYKAPLSDTDRVAVLTPGGEGAGAGGAPSLDPGRLPPRLASPSKAVSDMPERGPSATPPQPNRSSGQEQAILHRSVQGDSAIDRSVELLNQAERGRDARLAYRVTLVMANDHARELMASADGPPVVALTRDPCAVCVKLWGGLSVTTRLPFPTAKRSAMKIKMSRRQGYVHLTVPLLRGALQAPFSFATYAVEGGGPPRTLTLPSTVFWPPCVPLTSLPRLDLKSEWAHDKVMGPFSFSHTELKMRDSASPEMKGGMGAALLGVKETMLAIAKTGTDNKDELPVWPHPWVCLTEGHRDNGPAIWIWVNEILLDSSNEALVLDCCVMPVSNRVGHAPSAQLMESIELQGSTVMKVKAYPGELDQWAELLPVAVERARQTYAHAADCSYAKSSDARVTKSGDASQTLCGCGKGKDLPPWFMHSILLVNEMLAFDPRREPSVQSHFYRAALSPLYTPPDTTAFIDKAVISEILNRSGAAGAGASPAAASSGPACAKCGARGRSLLCTRCRKISYCSRECQVSHWRTHKRACG